MTKKKIIISIVGVLLLLSIFLIVDRINESKIQHISYTEFNQSLYSGEVKSASIEPKRILFSIKNNSGEFYTENPESTSLKEQLLLNNVEIIENTTSDDFMLVFDVLFYLLFFAMVGVAAYKFSQIFGGNNFHIDKNH